MKQLSIFDIMGAKTVIIHYCDHRGVKHTDEVEFHSLQDVRAWREAHKDIYFTGIEEKK